MIRRIALGAVVLAIASACLAEGVARHSASETTTESNICLRKEQRESLDGPLDWRAEGTITVGHTWRAARLPSDHGMISLHTTAEIVLDSVTLAPEDEKYFAPVALQGAWVSSSDTFDDVDAGHWPDALLPVACHTIAPIQSPLDWPVLVVRLTPPTYAAARGRKWSADRGIVVHYHTLDGTPYEAPFGDVNVYPTTPKQDAEQGARFLAWEWSRPGSLPSSLRSG